MPEATAIVQINSHNVLQAPVSGVRPAVRSRISQTSRIGAAMTDVLTATDELRRRLEERGDDAEAILLPLEQGLDATWEAIG